MEIQVDGSSLEIPAEMVANAFVQQYYNLLHGHPDHVHRFYQESSTLTRPGGDGLIITVTGMEAIKDVILSVDYTYVTAEIVTVDAQSSYRKGVIVIVTGRIIDNDHGRRKFTQTFFLAPQENGFFVLNDVFRYIVEVPVQDYHSANVGELHDNVPSLTSTHVPGMEVFTSPLVPKSADALTVNSVHENASDPVTVSNVQESDLPREEEILSVEEVQQLDSSKNVVQPATITSEDTPKKSYASIVSTGTTTNVAKASNTAMNASSNSGIPPKRVSPSAGGQQPRETRPAVVAQPQGAAASSESPYFNNDGRQKSNVEWTEAVHADKGYSIYVGDLPHDATVEQVENEFKKFGPIKCGGVQVRCNKGYFYGFVEYESLASMGKAIEAATIRIGGNEASIQEKRTATRVTNGGSSFQPRHGWYRNDNFSGRSNFNSGGHGGYVRNSYGGRNDYGRNVYGSRGDFPNSAAPSGNGNGYGRTHQNGGGRGGRQGGPRQ